MRDYVKEAAQILVENQQDAVDNIGEFIIKITEEIRALELQLQALRSLQGHLTFKVYGSPEPAIVDLIPEERVRIIRMRAEWLVKGGAKVITPQMIQDELAKDFIGLGVQHPNSVIATVLASWREFKRVGKGKFEYVGLVE